MYLYNARIHTLDPQRPNATALAIQGDRIVAIGDEAEIWAEFHASERSQDMAGQVILPGLTDAHIHLEMYALSLQRVDCETDTIQECLRRVAERARQTPPGEWILGHGWNQNNWSEGFGSAADLDTAAPDNPVYLTAKSYHAGWASTLALKQAGISAATPDPLNGRLGRAAHGAPDGILFESAMELVEQFVPAPSQEQVQAAIRLAAQALWRMGVTGVHDFDGRSCFMALQSLHERGELSLRVLKGIPLPDLQYALGLGLRSGFGDDMLRIGNVKAFMDGALGPQTAAMIQPFEGGLDSNREGLDSSRGMLFLDAEQLYEHGRLAAQNGLPMAVHAIGDRANHEALLAFEHLRRFELENKIASQGGRLRHRIEHVQLLHPDDAGLLAQLGVTASMQPIHATSDMLIADRYWGQRANYSYAWQLQLEHGANLAFGSDAPVEAPNPFWGLHAAITRRRQDGSPGEPGWIPAQKIGLQEALAAYTRGPAYAAGMEDRLGMLKAGFLADLIVLEQDPFEVKPQELFSLAPHSTMVGGKWVYQA
jgi:predicted amidohydrolase YtcJ